MDDWDSGDQYSGNEQKKTAGRAVSKGGWNIILTAVALITVTAFSFLMAWLTKDTENRPIWLMGLIFMVPVGAMFLAALGLEGTSLAMTPGYTRKSQIRTAILAVAGTFLVACACDALYLYGGYAGDAADDLIFLVYEDDVSGGSQIDLGITEVIGGIKDDFGKRVNVGVYMFDTSIFEENGVQHDSYNNTYVPLARLDDAQFQAIQNILLNGVKPNQIDYGCERAYEEVEMLQSGKHTRIIVVDPGTLGYGGDTALAAERLNRDNASFYVFGTTQDTGICYMVDHTGGQIIDYDNSENLLVGLEALTRTDGDMLRAQTDSAKILSAIMLILEGAVIGVGLWLMLSSEGQFRFQIILSPVLAAVAFEIVHIAGEQLISENWLREAVAFSLLGIVLMMQNGRTGTPVNTRQSNSIELPDADDF